MDLISPLSQQTRPNVFKPKVVELYETLFHDEHAEFSEGFWRELFLLKPDASSLRAILTSMDADELVHDRQYSSQQLFLRACDQVSHGTSPSDDIALYTLAVFLECVLNKKYTSPSSDTIAVLAGLEDVDSVFTGFVSALDGAMRVPRTLEIRQKAVLVAISAVSGAFQTGLVSYFISKDLFPTLVKLLQDSPDSDGTIYPLVLLTLLVNYNRFEFQNPYQLKLEDLTNKSTINTITTPVASALASCRDRYSGVQEDQPEGWNLAAALSWFGLGSLARRPQIMQSAITDEDADKVFSMLPPPETAVLLSVYDTVNANKNFGLNFILVSPDKNKDDFPFGGFLSLSSYMFQHAQRSSRASQYARLNLLTLLVLLSDSEIVGKVCSTDNAATVRLCRQRQPVLPSVREDRPLAAVILDTIVAGIDHNLQNPIDEELYQLFIFVILRTISHLAQTRTRLVYHWLELWRSLFALLNHLTITSPSSTHHSLTTALTIALTETLCLALTTGDSFLPDTTSYDNLFYHTYNSHDLLLQFRSIYFPTVTLAMETMTKTSAHSKELLEQHKNETGKTVTTPKDVGKVLRLGFEGEGFGADGTRDVEEVGMYREVEWRGLLKRIARVVVQDGKDMVARGM